MKNPWIGWFDRKRHLTHLNFNLHDQSNDKQLQLAGIIDTGFTGFIQVPLRIGLPLGLYSQPFVWGESKLANNSTQQIICKEVKVSVGNETKSGICNMPLVHECPILIGMDFLRCFDKMLIVSFSSGIYLVPDRDLTSS